MIIHVLRKRVVGTVMQNTITQGCGVLNIEGCRIASQDVIQQSGEKVTLSRDHIAEGYDRPNRTMFRTDKPKERSGPAVPSGRWPANFVHDGDERVVNAFPDCKGGVWRHTDGARVFNNNGKPTNSIITAFDDSFGPAVRFFQQVKLP